jgi:epidermal growth factor receptor substrate 15
MLNDCSILIVSQENNSAPYSNPELDMITKDIEELGREKHILETDIAQKEADIKIKNGEIKSLQVSLLPLFVIGDSSVSLAQ